MSPITTPHQFEKIFRVDAADIDELGHVNNIVYLRWVQEIATLHWETLATPQDIEELLWVVSRHEIDYKNAALLNDEIRVKTQVGAVSGLSFERLTEIYRLKDGQLLAKARTLWIPINRLTRKPQRLRPELRALCSSGGKMERNEQRKEA